MLREESVARRIMNCLFRCFEILNVNGLFEHPSDVFIDS